MKNDRNKSYNNDMHRGWRIMIHKTFNYNTSTCWNLY